MDGALGLTAGLPVITTSNGQLTTSSFGTIAGTFSQGNHVHGNITVGGMIGSTSGLPIITSTSGILIAGSFGTAAGTFCQGNDSRLTAFYAGSNSTSGPANSLNTSNSYQVLSLGVGTAAGISGEIRATNNITAYYSDMRLKTFISKIPDALNRVMQLNGYYFVENEIAKQLGYNNSKVQVGISAQEVELVLPEVVTSAPIENDQNYKTVWYDKLIPLLIEAIKELNIKVDKLGV